jgi:DNA repair protein RadA/Sms
MARHRPAFYCRHCEARFPKWMGRCSECGEWNTVEEDLSAYGPGVVSLSGRGGGAPGPSARPLAEVEAAASAGRLATGLEEVDRVLGGGLLAGSVTLLGGDPGIGKSTLVLQMLERLAAAGHGALYVSGEESPAQIKGRAERLGLADASLHLLAEVELGRIAAEMGRLAPRLVVVDSIQTVRSDALEAGAGSVSQVRSCAAHLIQLAKRDGSAVILVGHVTKDGALAGPRTLEHMVDVVLYLEGPEGRSERPQRILRSVKNRFGASNEIGLFTMTGRGLAAVADPGALFLGERIPEAAGTVVFVGMEGTRPLPVEIQALVGERTTAYPQRTAVGLDSNRSALLQAVIEKHLGDVLGGLDIFLNVVGGLRLSEPALDAAVVAALLSSFRNRPIDPATVVFGEVGLTGELRGVPFTPERLAEAARLGFRTAVLPAPRGDAPPAAPKGMRAVPAKTLSALSEALFP